MPKTVGRVGEELPANLSIVNSTSKEVMIATFILEVPPGMSASSEFFAKGCAGGQCVGRDRVEAGDIRHIGLTLIANQPGAFEPSGRLEWYFEDEPDVPFAKTEKLLVEIGLTAAEAPEAQTLGTPSGGDPQQEGTSSSLTSFRNVAIGVGAVAAFLTAIWRIRQLRRRDAGGT